MTINDQIRDEKLQYNIYREAAKISALSSRKIGKYEYLTGEDILPSNQQQIRKQDKFTYSSLGKAFEKQIKLIEDQGQKPTDASKTLEPKEQIEVFTHKSDDDDNTPISKEIYDEILEERMNEILKMSMEINYGNLQIYNLQIGKAIYKSKQNETKGTGLKTLSPKQMLHCLLFVSVKTNH